MGPLVLADLAIYQATDNARAGRSDIVAALHNALALVHIHSNCSRSRIRKTRLSQGKLARTETLPL